MTNIINEGMEKKEFDGVNLWIWLFMIGLILFCFFVLVGFIVWLI
jgi:hypothetical protein